MVYTVIEQFYVSGKIGQELELETEPEPKINNFGSATLVLYAIRRYSE